MNDPGFSAAGKFWWWRLKRIAARHRAGFRPGAARQVCAPAPALPTLGESGFES